MITLKHAAAVLALALPFAAHAGEPPATKSRSAETSSTLPLAGEVRIAGDEEILKAMRTHGAQVLVVNFWATWCPPCVEELPWFADVAKAQDPAKVRFLGISSDDPDTLDKKVRPFLEKKKIPYGNLVMDVNPETFIPKISKGWSGALPATIYYNPKGEKLGERLTAVSKAQLEADIAAVLAGKPLAAAAAK